MKQVLFEGSSTLGDYTIKAVQKNTGKSRIFQRRL